MQEMQETRVQSLGREDPLEEEMATHSVFLPGECHVQRSLAGYSPKGPKELDTTERARMKVAGAGGPGVQKGSCPKPPSTDLDLSGMVEDDQAQQDDRGEADEAFECKRV